MYDLVELMQDLYFIFINDCDSPQENSSAQSAQRR